MSNLGRSPEEMLLEWSTPPAGATASWYQRRGQAFERIIHAVLTRDGLQPRTRYRPAGEEVDGSFVLHHRAFLLEAKWWKVPRPASDLYAFRGKVDGKLAGTLGVFISMSGYSPDAIDALKLGKEINLILFNEQDFRLVCSGSISFSEAMERKLRYAAEEGQPFLPLAPEGDTDGGAPATASAKKWDLVVEGAADGVGMEVLLDRLRVLDRVRLWVAGGQMAVPGLVRHLQEDGKPNVAAIIESDAPPRVVSQLQYDLGPQSENLVVVETSIEELLEDACDPNYVNLVPPTSIKAKEMKRMASNADLGHLLSDQSALGRLLARIIASG